MIKERRSELTDGECLNVKEEKGNKRFANRIWILNMTDLKRDILSGAHESKYSVHPRSTKIYQDLKKDC